MHKCTEQENAKLHECRADSQGEETDHAVNPAHDVHAQSTEELQLLIWLHAQHLTRS